MGHVALTYRILAEDTAADLKKIEAAVASSVQKTGAKVQGSDVRPFAFGMKALILRVMVEDKEGIGDAVEAAIGGTKGVQGVELLEMGRLM